MNYFEINAALRGVLLEPLTDDQIAAVARARDNFDPFDTKLLNEARVLILRNSQIPTNFTESLDACHMVEMRLSFEQKQKYAAALLRVTAMGWEGIAIADANQRAVALVEVLELKQ